MKKKCETEKAMLRCNCKNCKINRDYYLRIMINNTVSQIFMKSVWNEKSADTKSKEMKE